MNLTIYCKSVEVKNCFDGYVQTELLEVDEDRFNYVDEDDISEYEDGAQTPAHAVEEFGVKKLLDKIGRDAAIEYFKLKLAE